MTKPDMSTQPRGAIGVLLLAGAALLAVGSSRAPRQARDPHTMVRQMSPPAAQAQDRWRAPGEGTPEVVTFERRYLYRGPHPIHPDFGSGFCTKPGLHREPYPPFEPDLFTLVDGAWVFVGDPSDFDYDGPLYAYANPHPLDEAHGGGWCYYPWPHNHDFLLEGPLYEAVGGVVYFIGQFASDFLSALPYWRRFYRGFYRRRYRRGRLYRTYHPRYARVGHNRYRRLHRRVPGRWFRPYRARRARLPSRAGRSVADGPATHGRRWLRRPGGGRSAHGARRYRPTWRARRLRRGLPGAWGRSGARRLRRSGPHSRGRLIRGEGLMRRRGHWRWRGHRGIRLPRGRPAGRLGRWRRRGPRRGRAATPARRWRRARRAFGSRRNRSVSRRGHHYRSGGHHSGGHRSGGHRSGGHHHR